MSLLLLGANQFNVKQELFSNNEQGLWLDPSDMTAGKAAWRRNLLGYSEQLDNSYWTKGATTVSANTTDTADPLGTNTADKILETTATSAHTIRVTATVTGGSNITFSFYAKAAGRDYIRFWEDVTTGKQGHFNLANGTATNSDLSSVAIQSVGNGWYRCSGVINSFTAASYGFRIHISTDGTTTSYAGDDTKGIYLWGLQLELGSTPSEYQPITDFSTEFKAAFPTHTLYQDSNGVTPCTDSGQPVGLILDQSRGGLGAAVEKLSNGSFDTDATGWTTANGTASVSSGKVTITNTAAYGEIYQAFTTVVGRHYVCSINLEAITGSGNVLFFIKSDSTSFSSPNRVDIITGGSAVIKQYSAFFVATATTTYIHAVNGSTSVGHSVTVDNISVREVPGNHAYQTTSGQRPTLARIPSSGRRNLLTRTEEFDNAAWNASAIGAPVTPNTSTGPFGGTVADTISFTTTGLRYGDYTSSVALVGRTFTFSCWLASTTGKSTIVLRLTNSSDGSDNTRTAINLTSTLTRYSVTRTFTNTGSTVQIGFDNRTALGGDGVAGDVIVFGAQLEESASATNYQKVGSTFDVTESGFNDLWHLVFDGSDDSLVTNSISFDTWTQETRRNLLVDTESFGSSNWTRLNITAADNTTETTDPLGTNTSSKLTASSSTTRCAQNFTGRTAGENWVFSFYVKAGTATQVQYIISNGLAETSNSIGEFTFSNQTFSGALGSYVTSRTATDVGNGWYRIVLICTIPAGQTAIRFNPALPIVNTETAYYWGAQAELATSATTYQRVGTDEMTVIAGVRKLSDAAAGMVAELSATASSNNGSFNFLAPRANGEASYAFTVNGGGSANLRSYTGLAAPRTEILSAIVSTTSADSAAAVSTRINGVGVTGTDVVSASATGNFGNYALFIGRRNQTSIPFNGHLYQLIIRGKTTPTGKLLEAERFVGRKTGVTGI